MKNFRKRLCLFLSASLVFATLSILPVYATDAESMVSTILKDYKTTSLQYAVIEGDKIIKSNNAGVYSRTENKSLTAETMYGIGSVSKMFTTTAVMELVEQGKIQLNAPVTQYIPEFKMEDERYKNITVKMLLNHSSGIMGTTLNNMFLYDDVDAGATKNLIANLATQRLKADPGAFSVYCNDGFTLAELVVERVSGMSFTTFVHQYITTPLTMKNTKTPVDDFDRNQLARTYDGEKTYAVPVETTNIIGTGGIYSTAEDICKFAQIFLNSETQKNQVLSKSSVDVMMAPEYLDGIWPEVAPGEEESLSYGLGWDSVSSNTFSDYGSTTLSKGGDTMYYHGTLVVLPEKNLAASVLSSGGSSAFDQFLAEELLKEVLQGKDMKSKNNVSETSPTAVSTVTSATAIQTTETAITAATPPSIATTTPVAVKQIPENTLAFEGFYAGSNTMKVKMTSTGALEITVPEVPGYIENYIHIGNGIFSNPTGAVKVSFIKETNGKSYIYVAGTSTIPGLGTASSRSYTAQKLDGNPISDEIIKAWTDRSTKQFFILNEKYSSILYNYNSLVAKLLPPMSASSGGIDGYMSVFKITDKNTARSVVEIPGTAGRDTKDLKFYMDGDFEHLNLNGNIAIEEGALSNIYNGKNSTCSIDKRGYAKWYKIGDAAGKTITVKAPKNSSFAVYDQAYATINNLRSTGIDTAKLPIRGYVVFAGEVGSKFSITLN